MPPAWLPLAALAFIVAASATRVWAVERSHNVKAFSFGRHAALQGLAERHWKLAVVTAFALAAMSWLTPEWEAQLGRVIIGQGVTQWVASVLFAVSALIIVTAQMQMGASWRVGVPKEGPGALVTHGLFSWSRNPIFVGLLGAMLALFVWSPHILTAALLAAIWTLTLVQVRIEEEALRETHGDSYEHYAAHVGRWFGRRSIHRC
ncbi:MAG: isoprenylcysteine carboxylmethyltransferase family protein [Hyphomonadaceae bacterium]